MICTKRFCWLLICSSNTPLHLAVFGGRSDIIDLLLGNGADVRIFCITWFFSPGRKLAYIMIFVFFLWKFSSCLKLFYSLGYSLSFQLNICLFLSVCHSMLTQWYIMSILLMRFFSKQTITTGEHRECRSEYTTAYCNSEQQ